MAHRYAIYLERLFKEWDIDCEYDKDGAVRKELRLDPAMPEVHRVPDIVIHRRGRKTNLVIIEAKIAPGRAHLDPEKLRAFMASKKYGYAFGATLTFDLTAQDVFVQRVQLPRAPRAVVQAAVVPQAGRRRYFS